MEPFLKTIYPSAYDYAEPLAALVDIHSRGIDSAWMAKRAAAGVFNHIDLRPERDHSVVHLIAMGATGRYGLNRNGDGFLRKEGAIVIPYPRDEGVPRNFPINRGLIETHDTFEKHGHVYRHHKNKDPNKREGDILKSAYHDPMDRVELLIKVANDKWEDDLQKLANGEDVEFSMSTKVPFDVCTYCGNKARSRKEYCDHAKYAMTAITKEGHQIGVMNDWMDFFDISRVRTRADRIALGLLKAAADTVIKSGAELAEELTLFPPDEAGLWTPVNILDKRAVLRKLSDIEKEIMATAGGDSVVNRLSRAFDPEVCPSLPEPIMDTLSSSRGRVMDVLGDMADVKISLPLKDFMRLLLGRRYSEAEPAVNEAKMLVPGIFGRMLESPADSLGSEGIELGGGVIPAPMRAMIHRLIPGHSLDGEPVQRRVTITILRGKSAPKLLGPAELEKKGSASELAQRLAHAYAWYKVAFCRRAGLENSLLTKLAVLQHYVL